MPQPKVTDEQANEALQQLLAQSHESEEADGPAPVETKQPDEEPAAPVEGDDAGGEPQAPEEDDIESLKERVTRMETEATEREKRAESRAKALQERFAENERILRERYVRKSNAANEALKLLKASRTEAGASEADVERVTRELEATMNPASPSYSPAPAQPVQATEDQAITLNNFLNERMMTIEEADEFANWIRKDAATALTKAEQDVAAQSLDGFLRIAHGRFLEGQRDKDKKAAKDDAVGAVKVVQRAQREAARAASGTASAPKKTTPAAPKNQVDVKKLTKNDVATLLRQSVEQYG